MTLCSMLILSIIQNESRRVQFISRALIYYHDGFLIIHIYLKIIAINSLNHIRFMMKIGTKEKLWINFHKDSSICTNKNFSLKKTEKSENISGIGYKSIETTSLKSFRTFFSISSQPKTSSKSIEKVLINYFPFFFNNFQFN